MHLLVPFALGVLESTEKFIVWWVEALGKGPPGSKCNAELILIYFNFSPELDDLTVGGLVMGTGIETSSHNYGLFQVGLWVFQFFHFDSMNAQRWMLWNVAMVGHHHDKNSYVRG
jgi:hypothetical protein